MVRTVLQQKEHSELDQETKLAQGELDHVRSGAYEPPKEHTSRKVNRAAAVVIDSVVVIVRVQSGLAVSSCLDVAD